MIGGLLDALRHARRRRDAAGRISLIAISSAKGFVIVARNYRLPSADGEADLIAWDGDTLVFVEVKYRESAEYGPPDRAIGAEKLGHMMRVARAYTRKTDTPWDRVASM